MRSMFYKKLLGLILMTAGWSTILGSNTMTISSTSIGPNQNFSVTVDISNSNTFVAFQFDLPLPSGFTYVSGSAALDPLRINGHLLDASIIPGNKLRVLGYSNSNLPFVGNSGPVVSFQLKAGVVPGSYPLLLAAPVIGDSNSINILTGSTNGTATLLAPDIHITTSLLDFIRTPLGSYTDNTLIISNTGNQPLNITGITFTSSYFSVVGNSVFTIGAGQSQNVQVRFTSLVKGIYDKKMTIACNDPDEATQQVSLHARAYAVNELHTGNMFAYSGKQGMLTFAINNMEPFKGFQFDLSLPPPLTYLDNTASLSGRKGDHVVSVNTILGDKLRVVVHSPTGQVFSGASGSVLTLSFNVKGIGGGYPLNLQNVIIGDTLGKNSLSDSFNGTLNVAAPDISSNSQLDFGDVSILESSQKTLRIYNYGNDTLNIEQGSITDPSYTLGTAMPIHVMTSGFVDILITFHQSTRGQSSGKLKIFSNDPDEYPYIVELSANAFVPNYITIPELSARYIDSVTVPVKISNIEPVVGFQFDLDIPGYMSFIPNSAALTDRASGYFLVAENITDTKVRVIAYSPSQIPLLGDTGIAVTLKFTLRAVNAQSSALLELSNGLLGNQESRNILWGLNNGIISIDRLPENVTIFGSVITGQAECHNATQFITVAGNGAVYTVSDGGNVTMIAGEKIQFLPGTKVYAGGYMHGYITNTGQYCANFYQSPDSSGYIEEKKSISSVGSLCKIYPNPTSGKCIIKMKDGVLLDGVTVRIYNSLGDLVHAALLNGAPYYEFSLSGNKAGLYFVFVVSKEKSETIKLIKQ